MTAQYPALPGLSSLSRWLTWITVHTPRSGLVIKTYRGNTCYLPLARSFFPFTPSPLTSSWSALVVFFNFFSSLSIRLFSTLSCKRLYLDTSTLLLAPCPPPFFSTMLLCPTRPHLLNPPFCVSSSPSIPPSLCIESGAVWLSLPPCWAGACLKGPRTLTHWGSPAMPEMPSLSSPLASYQFIWSLVISTGWRKRSNRVSFSSSCSFL